MKKATIMGKRRAAFSLFCLSIRMKSRWMTIIWYVMKRVYPYMLKGFPLKIL